MSLSDAMIENWQQLGTASPASVKEARLNAHYAVQVASAIGNTLLRPLPENSHTNLEWLKERRMLAGQPTDDHVRMRGAVKVQDLTLALLDRDNSVMGETELEGMTLEDATRWLCERVGKAKGKDPVELKRPDVSLPDFVVGAGKPFQRADEDAQRELSRWFQNADNLLRVLFTLEDDAGPVRCWPGRFEITCPISEDDYDDKIIVVGMRPGCANIDEPYFFVAPPKEPKEKEAQLAPIGDGLWQREGFFGAVLPMGRLREHGDDQLAQVRGFIDAALGACKAML
jgi:hypothetical protein